MEEGAQKRNKPNCIFFAAGNSSRNPQAFPSCFPCTLRLQPPEVNMTMSTSANCCWVLHRAALKLQDDKQKYEVGSVFHLSGHDFGVDMHVNQQSKH